MKPDRICHTSSLLRKHHLVVTQEGWGETAKFGYVDWQTYRPASKKRIVAFEKEEATLLNP
jgi:hypothetical protein